MRDSSREAALSAAFVRFADVLTSEYDVVELLHGVGLECVALIDVDSAGLLLKNQQGELQLVASTSAGADFVEVLQLNSGAAPCVESFRTGSVISVPDVEATGADWAQFRGAAKLQGYASAYSVPMRLRSEVIGAIGMFRRTPGELDGADSAIAQALASIATIGIMQERAIRESAILTDQLQRALESRIVIEQAKGVLAESAGVGMEDAFRMLRQHARDANLNLRTVAERVVDRSLVIDGPAGARPRR